MLPAQIIKKKRDGWRLSPEELEFFFDGFLKGTVVDYQMAAMLMAIFYQGLDSNELVHLTRLMAQSGRMWSWDKVRHRWPILVDKHSTGGVGDKTSLVLAPTLAALGVGVPMISGRGLGHTGGTLDKLESIPGFRTRLTPDEFETQLYEIGCVMAGQTSDLVPLDRDLYQLRDVTGTVESIPLIVASILSKKWAEGADAVVFDVKVGNGAFMTEMAQARELAHSLVKIFHQLGRKAVALITDMNQPLGRWAGNRVEVLEAMEVLKGDSSSQDLYDLTLELAAWMLHLADPQRNLEECHQAVVQVWQDGRAMQKWYQLVQKQGGRLEDLKAPQPVLTIHAEQEGWIVRMDTQKIGWLLVELKAGRRRVDDVIDPDVGAYFHAKWGDFVKKGAPLVTIYGNDPDAAKSQAPLWLSAFELGPEPKGSWPLVYQVVTAENS